MHVWVGFSWEIAVKDKTLLILSAAVLSSMQDNLLEIYDWWLEMVGLHPPSLLDV